MNPGFGILGIPGILCPPSNSFLPVGTTPFWSQMKCGKISRRAHLSNSQALLLAASFIFIYHYPMVSHGIVRPHYDRWGAAVHSAWQWISMLPEAIDNRGALRVPWQLQTVTKIVGLKSERDIWYDFFSAILKIEICLCAQHVEGVSQHVHVCWRVQQATEDVCSWKPGGSASVVVCVLNWVLISLPWTLEKLILHSDIHVIFLATPPFTHINWDFHQQWQELLHNFNWFETDARSEVGAAATDQAGTRGTGMWLLSLSFAMLYMLHLLCGWFRQPLLPLSPYNFSPSFSLFITACLCLSVCSSVCLSITVSLSMSIPLSLSLSLCSGSYFLCLSLLSLSISLHHSDTLISVFLPLSPSPRLYLFARLYLPLLCSLWQYVSPYSLALCLAYSMLDHYLSAVW